MKEYLPTSETRGVLIFTCKEPNEHYFLNSEQEAVEFLNESE
jgi:hypothetical protein